MKGALVVLVALVAIGALLWWNFDAAATRPHAPWFEAFLHETMEHSVRRQAAGIAVPELGDTAQVAEGAEHYFAMCEGCHGGPGVEPGELAQGLYPKPPLLHEEEEWSDAELFWIAQNGIKASGMPAYGGNHSESQLWAIVSFARTLPGLSVEDYEAFRPAAASDAAGGHDGHHHHGGHDHGSHAH